MERLPRRLRRRAASRYALRTLLSVLPWRRAGLTLRQCAARLNAAGWRTFAGAEWTVGRLAQVVSLGGRETLRRANFIPHTGDPASEHIILAALTAERIAGGVNAAI